MIKPKPFGRPSLGEPQDGDAAPEIVRGEREALLAELAHDMAAAPGSAPGTRMGAFALNSGLVRSRADAMGGPMAGMSGGDAAALHPAMGVFGAGRLDREDDDDRPARTARRSGPPAKKMAPWQRHIYTALGLCVALMIWTYVRDATAVSQAITEGMTQRTVLVCMDGRMYYSDPSLWSRLSGQGVFSCTDWRQVRGFGDITLP